MSSLPDFRVLRNVSKNSIATIFKGRAVIIKGKETITLSGHDAHEKADYLLATYGQLWDVTDSVIEDTIKDKKLKEVKNINYEQ